jgi:RecA/RadA recombinase
LATIKRFLPRAFPHEIYAGMTRGSLPMIISTGSMAVDGLLGGGIRTGMLTDIYGPGGSGKSQMCFTICANMARKFRQEKIVFVDTTGAFRPERISEILKIEKNSDGLLSNIILIRAFSTRDQTDAIQNIQDLNSKLVIIDSATSLFSHEFKGSARHLSLMKYLHNLSFTAIKQNCAIIITNMVRNVPSSSAAMMLSHPNRYSNLDDLRKNVALYSEQREFMGTSVSIYSHIRLRVGVIDQQRSIFEAFLEQPRKSKGVYFAITSKGVCDTK